MVWTSNYNHTKLWNACIDACFHLKVGSVKPQLTWSGEWVKKSNWKVWGVKTCQIHNISQHYDDVIMGTMGSQITSVSIVYSTVCSGANQRKKSKLCDTGLCAGNSQGTGEFPAQMASNAENVSIWWRRHVWRLPECTTNLSEAIRLIPIKLNNGSAPRLNGHYLTCMVDPTLQIL